MSLIDRKKILVTVGLNEVMTKSVSRHVPYGPAEVAASAIGCAEAGAAGVHFHARFDDGSQDMSGDQIYREAMERTALKSDIVMWTTAYPLGGDPASLEDVPHQWALTDRPPKGARLEFGCFDAFRVGRRPAWSEEERRFITVLSDWTFDPSIPYAPPPVLAEMLRRGLSPVFCCYDLADARWASCAVAAGVMPSPSLVQLQIFAQHVIGPSASEQSLDAYIAEARRAASPELSFVGFQYGSRGQYEDMLRMAIAKGCHIRVGLGDAGHLYPDHTNADVVARAVGIVREMGYEPATPTEMRQHFAVASNAGTP